MKRLNFFPDLKARWGIPYTRVHIGRLVKEQKFPHPCKPGGGEVGPNAWTDEQLAAYVERQIAISNAKAQVVRCDDGAFYVGTGPNAPGPFQSRKFAEQAAIAALNKEAAHASAA